MHDSWRYSFYQTSLRSLVSCAFICVVCITCPSGLKLKNFTIPLWWSWWIFDQLGGCENRQHLPLGRWITGKAHNLGVVVAIHCKRSGYLLKKHALYWNRPREALLWRFPFSFCMGWIATRLPFPTSPPWWPSATSKKCVSTCLRSSESMHPHVCGNPSESSPLLTKQKKDVGSPDPPNSQYGLSESATWST